MHPLAQRCAEPCHVPALRAVVFWMMKKAAESSQMRAAKEATMRGNGIGSFAGVSSDGGCNVDSMVKFARTIPSRQRRPAVMACACGVAAKSDGTLQSR